MKKIILTSLVVLMDIIQSEAQEVGLSFYTSYLAMDISPLPLVHFQYGDWVLT